MLTTITPAQMKALEDAFMAEYDVPGALLMEHAAAGICAALTRRVGRGTVAFLCGPGNNGGDGYAAARLWTAQGGKACIVEVTPDVHGDALTNRRLARMLHIPCLSAEDTEHLPACDAIVDALFGTGLSRAVTGDAGWLIRWANACHAAGTPVIAVDVPSGIDACTGRCLGSEIIRADETVTFHRIKQGLLLEHAPDYTGKLTVHPILIPEGEEPDLAYDGFSVLEPRDLSGGQLCRQPTWHKGDLGRVVLFCGSRGMAGAAALCANAAVRAGAGLTSILCRESLLPIVQTLAPSATCVPLPERDGMLLPAGADRAREALARADAACIGCGLGLDGDVMPILRAFARADCPVVWDADALTLISRFDDLLPLKEADVITPHPGEAARLLDCTADAVVHDMPAALERLHELCGCTVLLKGARSLITDGISTFCNLHTSPALAKGGSGDVLSGIITALLARRFPPAPSERMDSCLAAAYGALIHGLAGIRAARLHGEDASLPGDIVSAIRLDASGLDEC